MTNIRGYISTDVDPATDVLVFLSYALTDWCSKVGSDKAVVVTGHKQWETLPSITPTSTISLQLLLRGDGYRSGQSPWSPNMLMWSATSGRNGYTQLSSGLKGSYDTANPDDWTQWERDTSLYNSFRVKTDNISLGSSGYMYPTNGVTDDPEVSWAIYSDTPGKEWFSFHNPFDEDGTDGHTFLVRRYVPLGTAPTGSRDLGWVFVKPDTSHQFRAINNFNQADTSRIWSFSNIRSWLQTEAPGNPSASEVSAMQHSLPITNGAGALIGYMDDELLASDDRLKPPYNYKIGSAGTYTAIGNGCLIKTGD